MADCIVQLHCVTGCDANSAFYGKSKLSVYDMVAKNAVAQQLLSKCGDSLDLEEEVVEKLFKFTHVIYGDKKSTTMAEAHATKWKGMKNKSFICLPPDANSLCQYCLRANYLAYLVCHPNLKSHPSHSDMVGSWWVVTVALFVTHVLLYRHIYLHSGQAKRARRMVKRVRRMVKMKVLRKIEIKICRGGGVIHRNLIILNLARQNALIQTVSYSTFSLCMCV